MSGNGSGFSEFKSDDVLPVEKISATSSGDILNSMKSKLVGGKKEKKSSLKKGGKKILGGDEEEEEVPVVEEEFVVEEDSTVPADEELVVEEEFAVRDDKEEFMGGVPKATVMYDPYHIEPRREAIKLDPLVEEQKQKNIAEYEEFMKNNSKGGKKSAKKSKKSKNSKKSVKKFWLF